MDSAEVHYLIGKASRGYEAWRRFICFIQPDGFKSTEAMLDQLGTPRENSETMAAPSWLGIVIKLTIRRVDAVKKRGERWSGGKWHRRRSYLLNSADPA